MSGACPMCHGTDAQEMCAQGRCYFQEQIEAEENNRRAAEEEARQEEDWRRRIEEERGP